MAPPPPSVRKWWPRRRGVLCRQRELAQHMGHDLLRRGSSAAVVDSWRALYQCTRLSFWAVVHWRKNTTEVQKSGREATVWIINTRRGAVRRWLYLRCSPPSKSFSLSVRFTSTSPVVMSSAASHSHRRHGFYKSWHGAARGGLSKSPQDHPGQAVVGEICTDPITAGGDNAGVSWAGA